VNLLAGEKVTHIIHAGGVSGPMVLADNPVEVMTINVLGNLNLLYAAMDAGVTTFIYCSSAAALGSFHEDTPVDESYPLRARTTLTARRRRRWKWCYAACGARFRSISARCASP
jgi:UDP-glucose 4-epimerase